MKKNILNIIYVAVIAILAGVAIFIAVRLYQLRSEPVAPTAPESKPAAESVPDQTTQACDTLALSLTLATNTPSATPTEAPSFSSTDSPTATPVSTATPISSPTNSPASTPTQRATATPATSQAAQPTATPTIPPDVPVTGVSLPTILSLGIGITLILGAAIALMF